MKRLLFIVIGTVAIGVCYVSIGAPPVIGPPEEAKATTSVKPDSSAKEITDLKQLVANYEERLNQVVKAAAKVSADEHAARHDHALNQQVQISILEGELTKFRAQSVKN